MKYQHHQITIRKVDNGYLVYMPRAFIFKTIKEVNKYLRDYFDEKNNKK